MAYYFPFVLGREFCNKISKDLALHRTLGLYLISNDPNRVPHLAIQPVKLDLFNDYKGYSIRT